MKNVRKQDPITADIAQALGEREREPKMLWYVSPDFAKQVPVDFLETLQSAPGWVCEIIRTQRGAILVVFEASVIDLEKLTDIIESGAKLHQLDVDVLVQGEDQS